MRAFRVDLNPIRIVDEDNVSFCEDGKISKMVEHRSGYKTVIEPRIDSRRGYFADFNEAVKFADQKWQERLNYIKSLLAVAERDHHVFQITYDTFLKGEEAA